MFPVNKNIKIFFKYVLGPLLACWLFYSLYKQIKGQPGLHDSITQIRAAPYGPNAWKFWSVLALVFVNWGIEARKWQILVLPLQPFTFYKALRSVLCGVALSLNTPNRIGEYGGRILFIQPGNRIKAISLSIAGSISQLIITLTMGCGGLIFLIFFREHPELPIMGLSNYWLKVLLYGSIIGTISLIMFFFRLSWIIKMIEKIPALGKSVQYISVLEEFNNPLLFRLLSLSFFRFQVFVIQYLLLLQVMDVHLTMAQGYWIISVLFLVLSIIPSFAIADLGIRGTFSKELLILYSSNVVGIIGTTFGIWFVNLFIPAFAGSLLILGLRIFKSDKLNG